MHLVISLNLESEFGIITFLFTLDRSWPVVAVLSNETEQFLNKTATKQELATLFLSAVTEENIMEVLSRFNSLITVFLEQTSQLRQKPLFCFDQLRSNFKEMRVQELSLNIGVQAIKSKLQRFWKELLTNENAQPYREFRGNLVLMVVWC